MYGKDMPKFKPSRPRRDEAADRLPRPQHLQGRHLSAAAPTASPSTMPLPPGYPRAGVGLAADHAGAACTGGRASSTTATSCRCRSPRTAWRRATRCSWTARSTIRSASTSCTATCVELGARDQGRRAGDRLLRLVAARQLRVGRRLQAALRPGLRRLPEAEARPQGLVRLVQEGDRHERHERWPTRRRVPITQVTPPSGWPWSPLRDGLGEPSSPRPATRAAASAAVGRRRLAAAGAARRSSRQSVIASACAAGCSLVP